MDSTGQGSSSHDDGRRSDVGLFVRNPGAHDRRHRDRDPQQVQRHRGLDASKETGAIDRFRRQRDLDGLNAEVQPFGATLTYTIAISGGGGELRVKVRASIQKR